MWVEGVWFGAVAGGSWSGFRGCIKLQYDATAMAAMGPEIGPEAGPDRTGLRDLLVHWARVSPDAPALLGTDGDVCTFAQLLSVADHTRAVLAEAGLGGDDAVALALPDGPVLAVANMTVSSAAVSAPLNPRWERFERKSYLGDLAPAALAVPVAHDDIDAEGLPTVRFERTSSAGAYRLSADRVGSPQQPADRRGRDRALIVATSGTTGTSRRVPLTHANLAHAARDLAVALELTPEDRCLALSPLFRTDTMSPLWSGGSVVLPEQVEPASALDWITDLDVTWLTAGPAVYQHLARLAVGRRGRWAHLRFVHSSGAALPPALAEELSEVFGCPVIQGYGMAETYRIATTRPTAGGGRLGSVGRPLGLEVRVVDEHGGPLAVGSAGEVVVRGPSVSEGYLGGDDPAFRDGWFHTGDVGRFDEDGFLFLVGRRKEMINRGGEMISPQLVDDACLRHAGVREAATFAEPHPTLGEDVAVALVLDDAVDALDVRALQATVADRLGPSRVPRRVYVVPSLPRGPTGKVLRDAVTDLVGDPVGGARAEPEDPLVHESELRVVALWRDVLTDVLAHSPSGDVPIGRDSDFFALGGDSLALLVLCERIEEAAGRAVTVPELVAAPTVREQAAILRGPRARGGGRRDPLVTMKVGDGQRTPVAFAPGAGGSLAITRVILQAAMRCDRTVLGFECRGVHPGERPQRRIPAIAVEFLRSLDHALGTRAPALVGLSLGGVVIHHMAAELAAAQRPPAQVVLVDTMPPLVSRSVQDRRNKPWKLRFRRRLEWEYDWWTLRGRPDTDLARTDRCVATHRRAMDAHRPPRYPGDIVLITSDQHREWAGMADLGWSHFVDGTVECIPLTGSHEEVLRDDAATTWGVLAEVLDRVDR
jgi:oxalate---CoA ligase